VFFPAKEESRVFFPPDSFSSRLPHPDRPKCNSILHLIGVWLFEAAFIGSEYSKHSSDAAAATAATMAQVPIL
jgi:hypothetical protein